MALSKEAYSTYAANGVGTYRIRQLMTATQNVANNTSTVKVEAWMQSGDAYSYHSYNSLHYQSIDGVTSYNGYIQRAVSAGGSTLILSNSRTVTHNASGARSVHALSRYTNPLIGKHEVAATLVLNTIARATSPSLAGGGGFTTGSAKTINLPRASTSFTHVVTYKFGSATGTISSSAGASVSWTPPHTLAEYCKAAGSATVTITVVTKSGTSTVGTKTGSYTLTLASVVNPIISGVTWTDQNTTVKTAIGGFVQKASDIVGTFTTGYADPKYVVSIEQSARKFDIGGAILLAGQVLNMNSSGDITATAEATDARNRRTTLTSEFTVLAHQPPTFTGAAPTVYRANAAGAETILGTYLVVDMRAAAHTLKPSTTEKNRLSYKIEVKPSDGPWRTENTETMGGISKSGTIQLTGAPYAVDKSYQVKITLTDKIPVATGQEPTSLLMQVPTASVTLDLSGTKVGVGKYHERGGLDVSDSVYTDESFQVYKSATNITTYGASLINTPYGYMGYDFRGPTAKRLLLSAEGKAVENMRYYDETLKLTHIWTGSAWVKEILPGTLLGSYTQPTGNINTGSVALRLALSGLPSGLTVKVETSAISLFRQTGGVGRSYLRRNLSATNVTNTSGVIESVRHQNLPSGSMVQGTPALKGTVVVPSGGAVRFGVTSDSSLYGEDNPTIFAYAA